MYLPGVGDGLKSCEDMRELLTQSYVEGQASIHLPISVLSSFVSSMIS